MRIRPPQRLGILDDHHGMCFSSKHGQPSTWLTMIALLCMRSFARSLAPGMSGLCVLTTHHPSNHDGANIADFHSSSTTNRSTIMDNRRQQRFWYADHLIVMYTCAHTWSCCLPPILPHTVFFHVNTTVLIARGYRLHAILAPDEPSSYRGPMTTTTKATNRAACIAAVCTPTSQCRGVHYNTATHVCTALPNSAPLAAIQHTGTPTDWLVLYNRGFVLGVWCGGCGVGVWCGGYGVGDGVGYDQVIMFARGYKAPNHNVNSQSQCKSPTTLDANHQGSPHPPHRCRGVVSASPPGAGVVLSRHPPE